MKLDRKKYLILGVVILLIAIAICAVSVFVHKQNNITQQHISSGEVIASGEINEYEPNITETLPEIDDKESEGKIDSEKESNEEAIEDSSIIDDMAPNNEIGNDNNQVIEDIDNVVVVTANNNQNNDFEKVLNEREYIVTSDTNKPSSMNSNWKKYTSEERHNLLEQSSEIKNSYVWYKENGNVSLYSAPEPGISLLSNDVNITLTETNTSGTSTTRTYTTLQSAVSAASDPAQLKAGTYSEIKLNGNETVTAPVGFFNKKIKLDLNGKQIKGENYSSTTDNIQGIFGLYGGTYIITDSTKTGKIINTATTTGFDVRGIEIGTTDTELEVSDIDIEITSANGDGKGIISFSNSTITLKNVDIKCTGNSEENMMIGIAGSGKLNITNGSITVENKNGSAAGIHQGFRLTGTEITDHEASIGTITGTIITVNSANGTAYGIHSRSNSTETATISNVTINVTSMQKRAYAIYNDSTQASYIQKITGGTITVVAGAEYGYGIHIDSVATGTTTVDGTTINVKDSSSSANVTLRGISNNSNKVLTVNNANIKVTAIGTGKGVGIYSVGAVNVMKGSITVNTVTNSALGIDNSSASTGTSTINNITINLTSTQGKTYGIYNGSTQESCIRQITGGTITATAGAEYGYGIFMESVVTGTTIVDGTTIDVKDNSSSASVTLRGISNSSNKLLTVKNANIKVTAIGTGKGVGIYSVGIGNVTGGNITVNTVTSSALGIDNAETSTGTTTVDGTTINVTTTQEKAYGIYNRSTQTSCIRQITGGKITSTSGKSWGFGIYIPDTITGTTTVDGTTIDVKDISSSVSTTLNGIRNESNQSLTVNNANIKVTAIGTGKGVGIYSVGAVNVMKGSITVNTVTNSALGIDNISASTGTSTINGVTINVTATQEKAYGIYNRSTQASCIRQITGGAITSTAGKSWGYGLYIEGAVTGTTTVDGTTIDVKDISNSEKVGLYGISNNSNKLLTVKNADMNITVLGTGQGCAIDSDGELSITGGEFILNNAGGTVYSVINYEAANIKDLTITGQSASSNVAGIYSNATKITTLNNVNINLTTKASGYGYGVLSSKAGAVDITGGSITVSTENGAVYGVNNSASTTGTTKINGVKIEVSTKNHNAFGIHNSSTQNTFTQNIIGGSIKATSEIYNAYGIHIESGATGTTTVDGTTIEVIAIENGFLYGIYNDSSQLLTVKNINIKATAGGKGNGYGIMSNGVLNITKGNMTINTNSGNALGIDNNEASTGTSIISDVTINVTATQSRTYGIYNSSKQESCKRQITGGSITAVAGKEFGFGIFIANAEVGTTTVEGTTIDVKDISSSESVTLRGISNASNNVLTVNNANVTVTAKGTGQGTGIYSLGAVTATEGTITVNTVASSAFGIDNNSNSTGTSTISDVIINVTSTQKRTYAIYNRSTQESCKLQITGGTITATAGAEWGVGVYIEKPEVIGTTTVDGTTIVVKSNENASLAGIYGAINVTGGKVEVNSSTGAKNVYGIYISETTTVPTSVSGVEIIATGTGDCDVRGISEHSEIGMTATNNTINVESVAGPCFGISTKKSVLTGNTITATSTSGMAQGICIQEVSTSLISIANGTITASSTSGLSYGIRKVGTASTLVIGTEDGDVSKTIPTITGGTNGVKADKFEFYDGILKGKTSAYDGTVSKVQSGYGINYEEQAPYKVAYLSEANYSDGSMGYITLKDAFEKAPNGSTITVLRNYTDASKATLSGDKTITLNLDSKTLNKTASIINNGNMTLEGNGEIIAGPDVAELISNTGTLTIKQVTLTIKDNNTDYPRIVSQRGGTVTLDGGTMRTVAEGTPASTYKGSRGISMYGNSGIVNVKSGTINMGNADDESLGIEICVDSGEITSSINVTGGTISGTVYGILVQKNGTFKTTINVTGGKITSSKGCAIGTTSSNYAGNIIIGNKDGQVSVASPTLQGATYAINTTKGFEFYDGTLKGKTGAFNGTVTKVEDAYCVVYEEQDGYNAAYLEKANYTDETNYYMTLKDAFENAKSGSTIKVLKDVEDNVVATVPAEKTFTLDLNGMTVTANPSIYTDDGGFIVNKGSLTIKGSGKLQTNNPDICTIKVLIYNIGTLNITDGEIVHNGMQNKEHGVAFTIRTDSGTVTVSGGTLDAKDGNHESRTIGVFGDTLLNVQGGTIKNSGAEKSYVLEVYDKNQKSGAINISKGSLESENAIIIYNKEQENVSVSNEFKININGGTITSTNNTAIIDEGSNSTINITTGTVKGGINAINQSASGKINVVGGNVIGGKEGIAATGAGTITIGEKGNSVSTSVPEIKGETYGINSTNGFEFYDGILKGKTSAFEGEATKIEDGCAIVYEDKDGYNSAHLEAANYSDGNTNYMTLKDAFEKAPNGSTITVLRNVEETTLSDYSSTMSCNAILSADKELTLDLKGYTITSNVTLTDAKNITRHTFILNQGILTILDSSNSNGTINILGESEKTVGTWLNFIYQVGAGKLTINSGTVTVQSNTCMPGGVIDSSNQTEMNINGGTISVICSGSRGAEALFANGGKININGNPKIEAKGNTKNGSGINVHTGNGSADNQLTVVINGGSIDADYGIHFHKISENILNNISLNVSGNAKLEGTQYGIYNSEGTSGITIEGGTITGGISGIYQNVANDITITNATISGGTGAGIQLEGTVTSGTLTINDGANISSKGTTGAIVVTKDNNTNINVYGGKIEGGKNGIWIEDNATSNLTITSGTIIGTDGEGILVNDANTKVTLGTLGEDVSIEDPMIQGGTYGLKLPNGFKFYDGIIKGKTQAIDGAPSEVEPNYELYKTRNGDYEEAYLVKAITGEVVITGSNRCNSRLTADTSRISPTGCTFTYQWYYSNDNSTENGTKIDGATDMYLDIPSELEGKYIYVVVEASKEGLNSKTFADITDAENNIYARVASNKLMAREDPDGDIYYALGAKRAGKTEYTADKIKKIIIQDVITGPAGAAATWDVSRIDGTGGVLAWVVPDGADMYDLYIGAEGDIIGIDGQNLFRDYTNCIAITGLENITTVDMTDMSSMFRNNPKLTTFDVSSLNTENVTDMSGMFAGCSSVTVIDVAKFTTSKVTNMSEMFMDCNAVVKLDVSGFVTTDVQDISGMFAGCAAINSIDINNFDTTKVTNMSRLFDGCKSLTSIDFADITTASVTDMSRMFANCSKLKAIDILHFDTSKTQNVQEMFMGCTSLQALDLENFNVSSMTNMDGLFENDSNLISINLGANVDKLIGNNMFSGLSSLKILITARKISSSEEVIELGEETGIEELENLVLYVPGEDEEVYYEESATYEGRLGYDRIRPMLELIGEIDAVVLVGSTDYVDEGVKVVGIAPNEDATVYTQYGYELSVSGLPFETNTPAIKLVVYTLKDRYGNVVMTVTRTISVEENINVVTTEISTSNAKWSGWKLYGGATIDETGALNLTGLEQYAEKWFIVAGTEWSMGLNYMASGDDEMRDFSVDAEYYDKNFISVEADNGHTMDTLSISAAEEGWTYTNWNGYDGSGLNVEYVKVKISWNEELSGAPIKIDKLYFACNMNDTYTGIRVSVTTHEGSVDKIKYLLTTKDSGITEKDITEEAENDEIVWPKYGSKGTYYLWTYVTNTDGTSILNRTDPIIVDNVELELSNAGVSLAQETTVNAIAYDKGSIYDDSDPSIITRSKADNSVTTSEGTMSEILSAYHGSKAWRMEKIASENNETLHGMQDGKAFLKGLKSGTYILVSSNYRSSNSAGMKVFENPKLYNESHTKEYSISMVGKELSISDDNNEHHVYYLIKLNEDITDNAKFESAMPDWGYSSEAGNMEIDGLQWFVFSNEGEIRNDIEVTKYASGVKSVDYFREDGTIFTGRTFNVNANGLYTVYVRSTNGVERIRTIRVNTIDLDKPIVDVDLSGYVEGTRTGDDVSIVVTGIDTLSGVTNIEYSLNNKDWESIITTNNNNLLKNGDFYKLSERNYNWNTLLNGREMANDWLGYNSSVKSPTLGYHGHIDKNRFNSNVFALINKNSEFDLENRELYARQNIDAGVITGGTTYTLSFDIYADTADCGITTGLKYYLVGGKSSDFQNGSKNLIVADEEVGHWVRKSYTFTTEDELDERKVTELYLYGHKLQEEGSMYIKNIKLEEGSKATDWTPNNLEQNQAYRKGFTILDTTMDRTVYFKVTDAAGNYTIVTKHIIIDKSAPGIATIEINDNAARTNDEEVVVHIKSNVDDVKYMYISNQKREPLYSEWKPYKEYSKHELIVENGKKTVYVWLKDEAGNISSVASDDIELLATFELRLVCNQKYSGAENVSIKYAIRAENEATYRAWQTTDTYKGLIPNTTYYAKTRLEETTGAGKLFSESSELVFRAEYNEDNELVIRRLQ